MLDLFNFFIVFSITTLIKKIKTNLVILLFIKITYSLLTYMYIIYFRGVVKYLWHSAYVSNFPINVNLILILYYYNSVNTQSSMFKINYIQTIIYYSYIVLEIIFTRDN